jgi:hypothetical protein
VFAIPGIPGTKIDNVAGFIVALGLGLFGVIELWRRLPLAIIAGAVYTAVILVWPYLVARFLLPLVPLVVLAVVLGARRITARAKGGTAWAAPLGIAGLLTLVNLTAVSGKLRAQRGCDRARPVESSCFPPSSRGWFEAVALAGRRSPADAVFLAPKPATLYYLIGRRSVNELQAAALDTPRLAEFLDQQQVDYVLLSRIHVDQLSIAAGIYGLCRRWEVLGSFDDGATLLLSRPSGDRPASPNDACAAVAKLRGRPK